MDSNQKILAFAFTDAEEVRLALEESRVKPWFNKCACTFTETEKVGREDMHDVEQYLMGSGAELMSADEAYVSAIITKLLAGSYDGILLAYDDDKHELVDRIVPLLKKQKIVCYDASKNCTAV